jgi:hypothetical protein
MSKGQKAKTFGGSSRSAANSRRPGGRVTLGIAITAALVAGGVTWQVQRAAKNPVAQHAASVNSSKVPVDSSASLPTNEVAQAIMVTVELDFGGKPMTIKEALREVERRHQPNDGVGRTFAVLDAYGEPTPAGKLHMSMHVSMEKPGTGSLVFRRTGEVLWKSRIMPSKTGPPGEKQLSILMDDGTGKTLMLDGSKGATHVLNVPFRDSPFMVRDLWPDGQERELTYIYSACGCPVKAKVRRNGESTARTSELPVMFPDDPSAMTLIHQLMGWTESR